MPRLTLMLRVSAPLQVPVAFVTMAPDAAFDEGEIAAWDAERVAPHKRLR